MNYGPIEFSRDLPKLSDCDYAKTILCKDMWVQEYEGGPPIIARVYFADKRASRVVLLGTDGNRSPYSIYAWGPEFSYRPATDALTIEQARKIMLDRATEVDNTCPCCTRVVKLYKRRLHAEMALFLIKLVRSYKREPRWYTTRELLPATSKSSTDGAYLTRWRLVEKKTSNNTGGGKSGLYKPTQKGIEFAQGDIKVPAQVHLLCGEIMGFSEKLVSIRESLGTSFNYNELMRG